jgi:aminoglycoside phosphotransferase (APT) family kinase protein
VSDEVPLEGGALTAGVVRVGDTVRRPTGAWSPSVHALLQHLERVGYRHAPRFLGEDDRGREILSYAPGRTIWPQAPERLDDDATLHRAGATLAELHRAVATFEPPAGAVWWPCGDPHGGPLVLHGDAGSWNVVVDDDGSWTWIDWDSARPGRPEWEVALALLSFGGLWSEPDVDEAEAVRRAGVVADGYGIGGARLRLAVELIAPRCRSHWEHADAMAAAGDPAWVALRADGHGDMWRREEVHVAARSPVWCRLLRV